MAINPTEVEVEIHWVYIPADFFEEKVVRDCGSYSIEIEGGRVIARMSADFYDSVPGLRDAIGRDLNFYFLLWQLDRRKPFEIHAGAVFHTRPDGTKDTTIVLSSIVSIKGRNSKYYSHRSGRRGP